MLIKILNYPGQAAIYGAIAAIALSLTGCGEDPPAEQATQVVFVPVAREDVIVYRDYIGRTRPSEMVLVNARVDGFLESIDFVEGSTVTAGSVLYRIDPRPFNAKVERAQATLASRRAQLAKFKRDVERIGPLYQEDAASLLDYDEAVSAAEQGEAAVHVAEADLTQAKLELAYTEIRAPIDGVVGSTSVDVGAVIRASDTRRMTTVSTIDPLFVSYSMSALDYLNARRRALASLEAQQVEREGKALEGEVDLTLPDDTVYRYKGRVAFTDPQVNPDTGTFEVRAIVPNPDRELLPGQYTRVRMPISVNANALLVPEESIVVAQGGVYIMVITANNRIERRLIVPGPIVNRRMIVNKGVAEGERVAVHGINKVFHGSLVEPISMADYEARLAKERELALQKQQSENQGETPDSTAE